MKPTDKPRPAFNPACVICGHYLMPCATPNGVHPAYWEGPGPAPLYQITK